MRNLVMKCIVFIFVFSTISPFLVGEKAHAAQYSTDYIEIMRSLSVDESVNSSLTEPSGIIFVKVADFDGKGDDELLIVRADGGDSTTTIYKGKKVIYSETFNLDLGGGLYGVYEAVAGSKEGIIFKNKVKHVNTTDGDFDADGVEESYAVFRNNEVETLLSISYTTADNTTYTVNDEERTLTNSEYKKLVSKYDALQWEEVYSAGFETEQLRVQNTATAMINGYIEDMEKLTIPANVGENILGSFDDDFQKSLEQAVENSFFMDSFKAGQVFDDEALFQFITFPTTKIPYVEAGEVYVNDAPHFSLPEKETDEFLSVYLGSTFSDKEVMIESDAFPLLKQNGKYLHQGDNIGWTLLPALKTEGAYALTEDVYYIPFKIYDYLYTDFVNMAYERAEKMSMSELWKSFSKEEQMQGSLYQSGYVLLKKQIIDDRLQWTLIEKNIDGTSLDEKLVAQFSKMPLADPEVAFDVEKIKDMANIDAFIEYVQAEIEGKTLNEQDVTILVDFLSVGIQFFAQQALDAKKNELAVESEMLTAMVEEVNKLEQKITTELKLADHHLTKKLQTVVRFNVNHVDTNQAVQINLNKEMLQGLTEKDLVNKKIYFSLDGSTRGVLIKLSDLYQMFTKYDEVQVSISYLDKKIKLMIMDANGHEIGKLLIPIEIVAPVPSKDYVMFYDKEVWGGQYNDKNKSIIFQTKKSGTYDLVKNDVKISDIDKLTDEQKEAIEFLVARGFFDIEGDKFVPTATITRNDFSKTLVRLFFALDTDAKDNFSDVEKDSPYYKYISSGKENNILQGYPDETFRGENLISMSHVLSLAGRTLHSVKGYELTDDASKYLQFIDSERILDHARGDIALAIRENIYEQGGLLEPQRQITRLEAAEILMKLYTKLYDQPQYLYAVNVEQEKGSSINKWYVVVGIITSAIVVLLVLVVRRRKRVSKD